MTDFRTTAGIGARIQAIRKLRGMRYAHELAAAIPGGALTEAMIQNIESGRKENLTVTQLLNIAFALKVAPTYLLAAMGNSAAPLDLPGLSDGLSKLSAIEFDSWFSGLEVVGTPSWTSSDDKNERMQLAALRELQKSLHERDNLRTALAAERAADLTAAEIEELQRWDTNEERLSHAERTIARLSSFLENAGWNIDERRKQ
jgi:transcriptional regulator with XRE-family HTH domain